MRVSFCGVRGSTPAPGAGFVAVGGNTSCVAVTPAGADHPTLVLDAGTGIRTVTTLLDGEPFHGTILLSHLHWDHLQGLPFFAAGDRQDAEVQVLLPDDGVDAAEVLGRAMSPPHFPIGPDGLRGAWRFDTLAEGRHRIEGLEVTAREIPHKGGRTFGYRIVDGTGRSIAYLPDHRPGFDGRAGDAAMELAEGVDVLIHDAQFLASESRIADLYGHATVDQALELSIRARARRLVLFHHSPSRTDAELVAITAGLGAVEAPVILGFEGLELAW